MLINILTLFPGLFDPFLEESIVGSAVSRGLVDVRLVNFRDFAAGRHKVVDDRPFGGGPGMVLKPEPVFAAVESVLARSHEGPMDAMILLTPQGDRYDQETAIRLARKERLLVLCGRYEGFDERIREGFDWEEISIGDFVLSGGETAAMCLVESIVRLLPGALGHERSAWEDTLPGKRIEFPQYTRPRTFRGMSVPEILLSGDHEKIAAWRQEMSLERTRKRNPGGPAKKDAVAGRGKRGKEEK